MEEKKTAPVESPAPAIEPKIVKEKSKFPKFPRWIIITAVIVLVIILAIAAYFINKSLISKDQNINPESSSSALNPSKTRDTYTNEKYSFSIEYPGDWSYREFPDTKDGAAFNPIAKPGYPDNSDSIDISVGQKIGNYREDPFEDYVKIAGQEIQNYNSLASLKKVTTTDGVVGYETTWMVQPMAVMGKPPTTGETESLPITYFELPNSNTLLVRISLNREEDLETYEAMLKTLKFITPLNATPTPTVDEAAVLKNVIKKYIALKHNSDESSLSISVSKIEGNYAQGGVSDEGGGGMWFAAKEDGLWMLVWDGNGVIECSDISLYPEFPTSMIPECYNETTQETVKR